MNSYPAVGFLVKYGTVVALALSAVPVIVAVVLGVSGYRLWAVLALCTAPVGLLFLKAFMEIVALISDMLIPK